MNNLPIFKSGTLRSETGFVSPFTDFNIAYAVIEGAEPGPSLLVTAGVHGAEFCSIEAALRLMKTDPNEIRGTLVVLPMLNPGAFKARSVAVMPEDGKNLNRMFSGKRDGTSSERLANWLVENVFPYADAYLDLHGGDLTEEIVPLVIFPTGSDGSKELATAFGLPLIAESKNAGSAVAGAARIGVPSAMVEIGGNGLWSEAQQSEFAVGINRVMAFLGMHSGSMLPAKAELIKKVNLRSATAGRDGIWYPAKKLSDTVFAGEVIGEIHDAIGTVLESIRAEVDGMVCYRLTALSVNAQETLFGIGEIPA